RSVTGLIGFWQGKELGRRSRRMPPLAQQFEKLRRQHYIPLSLPLAPFDPQRHAPTVDVGHLQVRDLGHPEACAVGDAERGFFTVVRGRTRSGRWSVTVKKNRSAAMAALIDPGLICCCAICS